MLYRFVLSGLIAAFIAFAPSTSVEAEEPTPQPSRTKPTPQPSRTEPTPQPSRTKPTPQPLIIVMDETISFSDVFQSSLPLLMDESIGVMDTTTSSNVIMNEHVSIDDQMESKSYIVGESLSMGDSMDLGVMSNSDDQAEKSANEEQSNKSSDCLAQSGGKSSFGSIGLLTAPLALYIWRRMRKFKPDPLS